jgi:prophage maintenance system killer protein
MKKKQIKNEIIIYQTKTGAIEFKGDFEKDTIWATQKQIAEVFEVERSVVTKHINNILKDSEVEEKSNVQKLHIANSDKPIGFYSLDIILSVGYRTNSARAIDFRKWATKTLHQHITQGYTINKKQLAKNYEAFMQAVEGVKKMLPEGGQVGVDDALELIKMFASTWLSLEAYDEEQLPKTGVEKKHVTITAESVQKALLKLREELMMKKEASELFGLEKQKESVAGIVGNVLQSFGGKDLYPTVEEKAAHLLYFMVKNHPFIDGNKRSGAFTFVWFLHKTKILNTAKMTPEALTTLTLLVAESDPKDKDRMVGLILLLLKK